MNYLLRLFMNRLLQKNFDLAVSIHDMMVKKDGFGGIAEVFAACYHSISQPKEQQVPQVENIIQEFDEAKENQRSQPDHQVYEMHDVREELDRLDDGASWSDLDEINYHSLRVSKSQFQEVLRKSLNDLYSSLSSCFNIG